MACWEGRKEFRMIRVEGAWRKQRRVEKWLPEIKWLMGTVEGGMT